MKSILAIFSLFLLIGQYKEMSIKEYEELFNNPSSSGLPRDIKIKLKNGKTIISPVWGIPQSAKHQSDSIIWFFTYEVGESYSAYVTALNVNTGVFSHSELISLQTADSGFKDFYYGDFDDYLNFNYIKVSIEIDDTTSYEEGTIYYDPMLNKY